MALRRWLPLVAFLLAGAPALGLPVPGVGPEHPEASALAWPSATGSAPLPGAAPLWPGGRVRFRAVGLGAVQLALEPRLAPPLPPAPAWLRFETPGGSGLAFYLRATPGPPGREPERATSVTSLLDVAPEILLEAGPFGAPPAPRSRRRLGNGEERPALRLSLARGVGEPGAVLLLGTALCLTLRLRRPARRRA